MEKLRQLATVENPPQLDPLPQREVDLILLYVRLLNWRQGGEAATALAENRQPRPVNFIDYPTFCSRMTILQKPRMNGDTYSSRDSGRPRDYRDERRDRDRGDRPERGDRHERGERRRSRSPHYGSRGSRREQESNSYSSSRDYRAREREDRYSSRRDDREWDRDRGNRGERGGDRGDRRRRDDDRPRRDLFDDRSRRGGDRDRYDRGDRDRGDRGNYRGGDRRDQGRRGSASPPRGRKEPTPDLTDVPSVLERRRRMTQWDIKPPGYENVPAEQAKLSGMFPLPGAPRQQADPSRLQAFMNQPAGGSTEITALKISNSRQAKRLFVYNIPEGISGDAISSFFNLQLNGLNVVHSVDPCATAHVSDDKKFASLEFKTANDATVAFTLDGISMTDNGEKGLEIHRPKDYIVPDSNQEYQEGVLLKEVPDSPNKICVSNIPPFIPEEAVIMLVKSFGELKSFVLVKDASTDESRGFAFCEYVKPEANEVALEGINGMELGERPLKVTMACTGARQAPGLDMSVNAMSMFAQTTSQDMITSRVLQLLNMVTVDDLLDEEEYEDIWESVEEECNKLGKVVKMKIPRPKDANDASCRAPGIGKIYVKFENVEGATQALKALAGRQFDNRTVVASYFGEENFDSDAW